MLNDSERRKGRAIEKRVDENGKICEMNLREQSLSGRLIIRALCHRGGRPSDACTENPPIEQTSFVK